MLKGKKLLITGGTGSFGKTILKHVLNKGLNKIIVYSRDELKQDLMRRNIEGENIKYIIGDVRDYESVKNVVKGVNYIFHAAALKQVPSCEFFPMEAVYTNIIGTNNVLSAALEYDVEKVVVLSTDKAVYPINTMGMTKALMEKVMVAKSLISDKNNSVLCGTRYGNVMGSRGSVIPLFIEQIKSGAPITITDPNMTRFMMDLEDAIKLVLYAFEHGNNGDIYILKSPASTVLTLAKALLKIYNSNNEIKIIGTRHGEKLYETLINREEMAKVIDLKNYFKIPSDKRGLNYSQYFSKGEEKISTSKEYTSHNTTQLTLSEMETMLLGLDFIKNDIGT